jgi:hypothetical protein
LHDLGILFDVDDEGRVEVFGVAEGEDTGKGFNRTDGFHTGPLGLGNGFGAGAVDAVELFAKIFEDCFVGGFGFGLIFFLEAKVFVVEIYTTKKMVSSTEWWNYNQAWKRRTLHDSQPDILRLHLLGNISQPTIINGARPVRHIDDILDIFQFSAITHNHIYSNNDR